MARELFGTDGVRGRAGHFLSAELALKLARAAVQPIEADRPQVLIIRDTRESGEMLESAIAAGVTAGGGDALLGGVLPTPAAPLLLRRHGLDLAAVISASHNPYEDNGIKLFAADGFKLHDDTEHEIEARLDQPPPAPENIGRVRRFHGALEDYLRELHVRFSELDLSGTSVLLDCANGATFTAGPEIFRRLGASVEVISDRPDGRNINHDCGSTHLEAIVERMSQGAHDVGFAFDGDGDRVLAIDRTGTVVDGDELIALAAIHLRDQGRLLGDGVAVTVMTNYGFHTAMAEREINVATTAVGDRYVLDELRRRGWSLGGEQSGHIIDLGFGPSGDGIASALLVLEALGGRELHERDAMQKLPQRLVNVRAADRAALSGAMESSEVQRAIEREGDALEGRGRVLVRASGTEPLIRVMVEAPGEEETDAVCTRLTRAVEEALEGAQRETT
jgi:phosphoglucosamine mutase